MARSYVLPGGLLGLVLAGMLGVVALDGRPDQGLVYTVVQVQARLASDRRAGLGRTVWVRAHADACLIWTDRPGKPCIERQPVLIDAGAGEAVQALPLVQGPTCPLLALLRHVPVLATLAPGPQADHWGAVPTYRVQLRTVPAAPVPGTSSATQRFGSTLRPARRRGLGI